MAWSHQIQNYFRFIFPVQPMLITTYQLKTYSLTSSGHLTVPFFFIYHHHHVVPLAQISLTLSHYFSLSFIASGRSSGLHPLSSHSCWMYVQAGRPAFARPYVGVHRSTSLMSSSLLLQQCPACLVCLIWIVFVMGGRWPYSWCLVECCSQVYIYIYIYYLLGMSLSITLYCQSMEW